MLQPAQPGGDDRLYLLGALRRSATGPCVETSCRGLRATRLAQVSDGVLQFLSDVLEVVDAVDEVASVVIAAASLFILVNIQTLGKPSHDFRKVLRERVHAAAGAGEVRAGATSRAPEVLGDPDGATLVIHHDDKDVTTESFGPVAAAARRLDRQDPVSVEKCICNHPLPVADLLIDMGRRNWKALRSQALTRGQ